MIDHEAKRDSIIAFCFACGDKRDPDFAC